MGFLNSYGLMLCGETALVTYDSGYNFVYRINDGDVEDKIETLLVKHFLADACRLKSIEFHIKNNKDDDHTAVGITISLDKGTLWKVNYEPEITRENTQVYNALKGLFDRIHPTVWL